MSESAGKDTPAFTPCAPVCSAAGRLEEIPVRLASAGTGARATVRRTVFVKTWGCQMNEYDSQKMIDILHDRCQLQAVAEPEQADLILMNTCSVREKAQEKVFSELGRWRKIKSARPQVVIGVGGCVASQEGELLRRRAPWVDIVFGPQTLHRLPEMVERVRVHRKPVVDISFPRVEKFDELVPSRRDGISAYVSVMEGCSKYCSFCVVPYTRGREVSRDWRGVVAEIADLSQRGVREFTLLGQNVNAWNGRGDDGAQLDFAWLLKLIEGIDGVGRIRYTTSHPLEMTGRLIEAHKSIGRLMPFLHLPVQSGSDRVLTAMKRGYTALEYKSIIRQIRRARPDISLSSDFIVAFPGESEDDHRATMSLAEEVFFDHSYSFVYSPRPGTPAASLSGQIDAVTAARRLQELQALLREQSRASRRALLGKTVELLVERRPQPISEQPVRLRGRTPCNRVVSLMCDSIWQGRTVRALITGAGDEGLEGELVAGPGSQPRATS